MFPCLTWLRGGGAIHALEQMRHCRNMGMSHLFRGGIVSWKCPPSAETQGTCQKSGTQFFVANCSRQMLMEKVHCNMFTGKCFTAECSRRNVHYKGSPQNVRGNIFHIRFQMFPCSKMAPRGGAIHAPEQMRHSHMAI